MGLEISVCLSQYLIREIERDYEENPGLSDTGGGAVRKFGPYFFGASAQRKVRSLIQERIRDGWTDVKDPRYPRVVKGINDVFYEIRRISRRVV